MNLLIVFLFFSFLLKSICLVFSMRSSLFSLVFYFPLVFPRRKHQVFPLLCLWYCIVTSWFFISSWFDSLCPFGWMKRSFRLWSILWLCCFDFFLNTPLSLSPFALMIYNHVNCCLFTHVQITSTPFLSTYTHIYTFFLFFFWTLSSSHSSSHTFAPSSCYLWFM